MTNSARDAALTSLFLDLRANNGGSPQQYKLMCLSALATMTKQDRAEVPLAWKRVVGGARRHGASWEDVARVLQMTPEGAKRLWSADLPGPYRLDVIDSASEAGVDDYLALIASAPGFTGEDILSFLVSSSQLEAPSRRSRLQNTLQTLAQIAHGLAKDNDAFPCHASDPVALLARRVIGGEIGLDEARRQAALPPNRLAMTPTYASAATGWAITAAQSGEWRYALAVVRILLAGVAAGEPLAQTVEARRLAEENFLLVAHVVLQQVPDGRLLREARATGDRLVANAHENQDGPASGRASYRLGGLFLDPVKAFLSGQARNEAIFVDRWQETMRARLGQEFGLASPTELAFPRPLQALETAERYYRDAVVFRVGNDRGMAAKALLETLVWQRFFNKAVDEAELDDLGHQALCLLDPSVSPHHRDTVRLLLNDRGHEDTDERSEPLEQMIARLGLAQALEHVLVQVESDRTDKPERALARLAEAEPILRADAQENTRLQASLLLVLVLSELAPTNRPGLSETALRATLSCAQTNGWSKLETAAALIALAGELADQDREETGLRALEHAREVCPELFVAHADELSVLLGVLHLGAGASAFHASRFVDAVNWYVVALRDALRLRLLARAFEIVRRLADVVAWTPTEAASPTTAVVLQAFAPLVIDVERQLGDEIQADLVALFEQASAAAFETHDTNSFTFARTLMKGAAFRVMRRGHPADALADDEELDRLLASVDTAATPVATAGTSTHEHGIDLDSRALTAYVSAHELAQGGSARELLENQQRRATSTSGVDS